MSIESAFVAALPASACPTLDTNRALDSVTAAIEAAKRRWPALAVDPEAVASFVAARIGPQTLTEQVEGLALVDVVLAVGCTTHAPGAVETFVQEYGREIDHLRVQTGLSSMPADELRQRVLEHLLVARADGPPRIAGYRGEGSLHRWVKMATTRVAIDLRRRASTRAGLEEPAVLASVVTDAGEGVLLRLQLLPAFRQAVRDVLSALSDDDRALLQLRYVEGLSVTELAELRGIHRVTMSRGLTKLRERVGEQVQARVSELKAIPREELARALDEVRSRLDFTLSVLTRASPPSGA